MPDDARLTRSDRLRFALVLVLAGLVALLAACACAPRPISTPEEQYRAATLIQTACLADDLTVAHTFRGSGVVVGPHRILTAGHVVTCPAGETRMVTVDPGDGKMHVAAVEVELPMRDVASLTVVDSLAPWTVSTRVVEPPAIGAQICESSAWPRYTYRCGPVQPLHDGSPGGEATLAGDIGVDLFIEFGNSGSGLYDARGDLVGIMVSGTRCQENMPCLAHASALAPIYWLLTISGT